MLQANVTCLFLVLVSCHEVVCNALFKRVSTAAKDEGSAALGEIRQLRADLATDIQRLPMSDRVAPRSTSEAQLDLNQAKLFIQDREKKQRFLQIVTDRMAGITVPFRGHQVLRQVPLTIMLSALHEAWSVWSLRTLATHDIILSYERAMARFGEAWTACGWKPTLWVHWMVCHSASYLSLHKTLYAFSSIPTEYRHKFFKLDVSHSCMAWKMSRPAYSQRSLQHVVRMHALDLILMRDITVKGHKKRVL